MSDAVYSSLRGNVSFLGRLLGETIAAAEGQAFLDLVEQIRRLSKSAREGSREAREELQAVLRNLGNEQLVPVARAFSQFLNLANIADQHHNVSRGADPLLSASRSLATGMGELLAEGVPPAALIANLVYGNGPSPDAIRRVMIGGRTVVQDGEHVTVDRREAVRRSDALQEIVLDEVNARRFVRMRTRFDWVGE